MGSLINGIHHVALKCTGEEELSRTIAFYGEVLGLERVRSWGEGKNFGIMFRAGSSLIEIFADGEERLEAGALRHIAFATADTDACAARVKAAGYDVFMQPNDIVIGSTPPFPARIAFCKGPVGEEIEFFQER